MNDSTKVVALSLLLLGTIGCKDSWEKHFPDVATAKREGLIEKGWIPDFIPPDAVDLLVIADLDAGTALGSFTSVDPETLGRQCTDAAAIDLIPGYASRFLAVGDERSVAKLRQRGYDVLRCNGGKFDFASVTSSHRFYYWTPQRK